MKLFVFGNEYLAEDSMARRVAAEVDADIVHCRSPDELMDEDNILILDVVKGAKEVMIIDDITKIKSSPMVSLHDFDLGFFLKLTEEMGMKKNIKIIGIPESGDVEELAKEVQECLNEQD